MWASVSLLISVLLILVVWPGMISDIIRSRTQYKRKTSPLADRVYLEVLPFQWVLWAASALRFSTGIVSGSVGYRLFFAVLNILLAYFWWKKWKSDTDRRWARRMSAMKFWSSQRGSVQ